MFDRAAHLKAIADRRRGKPVPKEVGQKISKAKKGKQMGASNPHWKGGRIEVSGYVYIYSPGHPNRTLDGYVCEHRLVMEKHLGRLLTSREAVHHLDGNSRNNGIENLELCASNGRHTIEHHAARGSNGRFTCV